MDFFSNFKWAIPVAFSDAVSLCRFEEGDTLYDSRIAYEENWDVACTRIGNSLQVRFPVRVSSHGAKEVKSVFDRNWSSPVKVDLYTRFSKTRSITTTQGNLYAALWKGDLSSLDIQTSPAKPIRLKEVMKMLDEIKVSDSNYTKGRRVFVLPRDNSNSVSRLKFQKVYSCLRDHLLGAPTILSPAKAGFKHWSQIAPTIDFVIFSVNLQSAEEIAELVKSAVYAPSKGADGSRFKILRHGLILEDGGNYS